MIALNFSHPLTEEQKQQIEAQTGLPIERVVAVNSQIDPQQPSAPQVINLLGDAGLRHQEWLTKRLLIVSHDINFTTVTLMEHIQRLTGYLPPVVRMRQVQDAVPPRYEVDRIINPQAVREQARRRRGE